MFVVIIIHCYHHYHPLLLSLSSFVINKTILNILFFLTLLSCRISHRVAFTQRESFKNYSPQSGTVILKQAKISAPTFSVQIKSLQCFVDFKNSTKLRRYYKFYEDSNVGMTCKSLSLSLSL